MPGSQIRDISRRQFLAAGGALGLALTTAPLRAEGDARIEIDGNRFTYRGRPLRLTGVAMGDPMYIRQPRPASDYGVVAGDWLANCVRLSVFPGHWRADSAAVKEKLAQEVALARSLHLFVIIDWHPIGFPGRHEPLVPEEWGLPIDVFQSTLDEAEQFWREMTAIYGADPTILFELWNEPVADEKLWQATGEHWGLFKPAWERLIAAIRETSDNIILATGGYWAHDLVGIRDNPLADPRTAYAWHAYPNSERNNPERRLQSLGGLQDVKPIVVTEWGFCVDCQDDYRATLDEFGRPLVDDIIDPLGLSHTAWCFSVGAMPNLLASDDGALSAAGAFVREVLRQSANESTWMLGV